MLLKKETEKQIIEGVKIKIPSIDETNKILKQLNKIAKTEEDDINYDNPKVIYTLFKKLVVSDIKEIKNINEADFMDAYYNPTPEMEEICFELGRVISNGIKSFLRANIANLEVTEMNLLQAEAITSLNNISTSAKNIEKSKVNNK